MASINGMRASYNAEPIDSRIPSVDRGAARCFRRFTRRHIRLAPMSAKESRYLLERFSRQEVLTAPRPRRSQVTELIVDEPVKFTGTVSVWRNHAFEPLQPLLDPFLKSAGLALNFVLGGYDDSLSVPPHREADLDLVWFDLDRLKLADNEALDWFVSRIIRCSASGSGRVVVVPFSSRPGHTAELVGRLQGMPGVRSADPWTICNDVGIALSDERTATLAGTRVSRDAQLQLARALGTRWLPASLLGPLKMVAVDLDDTLHRGILGEDGIGGVTITPAHARLHAYLKELAASGIFLALISRNELEDVKHLFMVRQAEYGLSLDDFVAIEVSWGSKADAVQRAAAAARIGEDAVVFVDDNAGELLDVALHCPGVILVHAEMDADRTLDALRWQPGLWRWAGDDAAAIRIDDLAANAAREQILNEASDFGRYLEELGIRVDICVDQDEQLRRLADLSVKTNQFNLTTARFHEADLHRVMRDRKSNVVSVGLADRLSESGIIALLVVKRQGSRLHVDELAISCRAVGRGLESLLIVQALRAVPGWDDIEDVSFWVEETDRNLPARRWLRDIADLGDDTACNGEVVVDRARFDDISVPDAVAISVVGPNENLS